MLLVTIGLVSLAPLAQEGAGCSLSRSEIDPTEYEPTEVGASLAGCTEGEDVRLFVGSFWSAEWGGELRSILWDGEDGRTTWSIRGEPGTFLGWSLALGPDADADGTRDVFVGAPRFGSGPGKVELVSGRTGKLLGSIEGPVELDEFGYDIDCKGDLDGDGVADLVVGAPGMGTRGFYVVSGKTLAILGCCERSEPGADKMSAIGGTVRVIGDVDSDGTLDIAAAAWFEEVLTVWSGRERRLLWTDQGELWRSYGWEIETLDDLDGDAVGEVAIASPEAFDEPIEIRSGKEGALLRCIGYPRSREDRSRAERASRGKISSRFGNSLVRLPDIDGDDKADLAVGAPGSRLHTAGVFGLELTPHEAARRRALENRRGFVTVYASRTFEPLFEFASAREDDWFGVTLATVPDCDGDGLVDLFVGGGQGGGRLASIHSSRDGELVVELTE
jgi:hypothetical protein